MTADECRDKFLAHLAGIVQYWANESRSHAARKTERVGVIDARSARWRDTEVRRVPLAARRRRGIPSRGWRIVVAAGHGDAERSA